MNDALAAEICRAVDSLVAEGRLDTGNPDHLARLVEYVRDNVPGVAGVAEDELWVVTCMGWLVPGCAVSPPRAMREALTDLVRRHVPDETLRPGRVMEFAIAFGCGRWRHVVRGHGTWDQRWPNAMLALGRAMVPAVGESNRWLADVVVGFVDPGSRDARAVANRLALMVVSWGHPLVGGHAIRITCTPDGVSIEVGEKPHTEIPAGAKFIFDVTGEARLRSEKADVPWSAGVRVVLLARDDNAWVQAEGLKCVTLDPWEAAEVGPASAVVIRECSCGHKDCEHRHQRLEGWDPAKPKVTLWSYVASAVKGPQPKIQSGSFVQGIYFALLAREGSEVGRVRGAAVESKSCGCGIKYEGRACPECHEPFDAQRTKKVADDRLIVVGTIPLYRREARRTCRGCGNLHDATTCPLCGGPPTQRPSHVWVRTFAHRVEAADLDLIPGDEEGGGDD